MSCYVMSCYVMLCYVMLCYVVSCYVTLWAFYDNSSRFGKFMEIFFADDGTF
jgi:hypothetical protein